MAGVVVFIFATAMAIERNILHVGRWSGALFLVDITSLVSYRDEERKPGEHHGEGGGDKQAEIDMLRKQNKKMKPIKSIEKYRAAHLILN